LENKCLLEFVKIPKIIFFSNIKMPPMNKSYGKKKKILVKGKKKPVYNKTQNLVSLIKKISLKQQETKHVIRNLLSNTGMQHNVFARVVSNLMYTEQGIGDSGVTLANRIGDSITPIGIKLYVQLSQPVDRPNVTFKLAVLKFHGAVVPPGTVPQTGVTGNVMLDPIDTEKCSVLKTWTYKSNENYWQGSAATSKIITKFFTLWIPLPRKPYVYASDGGSTGKMFQLSFCCAAYDSFGTLITDTVGNISLSSQLYFKDA